MDECPHCKSVIGFTVRNIIVCTELFNFHGECIDVSGDTDEEEGAFCFTCKKIIGLSKYLKN